MARVQMLLTITGGHASGNEWPLTGEFLETSEDEARHLVAGGMARWPEGDAQQAAAKSPEAATGDEQDDAENGAESDGKPRVRDPKEAWEAYAMTQGLDVHAARAMTKADLIAAYGNPAA